MEAGGELPIFLAIPDLISFIDEDLRLAVSKPTVYITKNGAQASAENFPCRFINPHAVPIGLNAEYEALCLEILDIGGGFVEIFLRLLEISRSLNDKKVSALIKERNYEELEILIVKSLIK